MWVSIRMTVPASDASSSCSAVPTGDRVIFGVRPALIVVVKTRLSTIVGEPAGVRASAGVFAEPAAGAAAGAAGVVFAGAAVFGALSAAASGEPAVAAFVGSVEVPVVFAESA